LIDRFTHLVLTRQISTITTNKRVLSLIKIVKTRQKQNRRWISWK